MSLITIIFVLMTGLVFVKCQYTTCNRDNIFQITANTLKSVLSYIFDIFSYAIKRFTEIDWQLWPRDRQ